MSQLVEADRPVKNRHAVLAPYLDRLAQALQGRNDAVPTIADTWESKIVGRVLGSSNHDGAGEAGEADEADEADEDWWTLVVDGVAFLNKLEADMGRLKTSEAIAADKVTTLHAQLMTDAAIGLALMEECQRAVDAIVLSGRIDQAKKVTAFRSKIVQAVAGIKETIGPVAYQAAETLSARMIPEARLLRGPALKNAKLPPGRTTVKPVRHASARAVRAPEPDPSPNYTRPLLVLLGLLLVAWAVFVLPLLNRPELPLISETQVPVSDAIAGLTPRPPSLFVEIDRAAWDGLAEGGREQLVADVGSVAKASGYSGVVFRDASGKVHAQWLKEGGQTLIGAGE